MNLSIWSFLFAAVSGCGIAFLGVLQEGTANDADSTIWQFYWSATTDTGERSCSDNAMSVWISV